MGTTKCPYKSDKKAFIILFKLNLMKMEKKINQLMRSIFFAVLILSSSSISAQCFYNLQLFDSFGDGWNGAAVTITVNGAATTYLLDDINDDGSFAAFNILINDGDTFSVDYIDGAWEGEVSYFLFDSEENLLFTDGPNPVVGTDVFMGTGACPSCPGPLPSSVSIDKVRAVFADISWTIPGTGTSIIEYGMAGFVPGTGTFVNTTNTAYTLTNLAENTEYELYVSLDCGMDTSSVVGPYPFKTIWLNDVGVVGVIQPNPESCALGVDSIEILLKNFGQLPQSLIPLQFSVNGVPANVPVPLDGYYTGVISFDSTTTYVFDATWDFAEPGTYLIEVWTEFEPDSNIENDTFSYEFTSVNPFPLIEDFEAGIVPEGWEVDFDIFVDDGHNALSNVIFDNLFGGDTEMIVATPIYGLVSAGDEFTFDYRYTDWSAGTDGAILAGDQLQVQVTTDCGATYNTIYTIDDVNHTVSADFANVALDISAFAGESVGFRFFATWANGDYWLDIDNVNVIACPSSLSLIVDITEPSSTGASDGAANVNPVQGVPPYMYSWSNGNTTNAISGLGDGTYTVVVTDSIGCVDEATFTFGTGVATYDIETLETVKIFPNPTLGQATLQVGFNEATDVKVQIIDIYGKIISEEFHSGILDKNISLASDRFEAGMYFIRLETKGKWHLEKLLKL